MEGIHEGVDLGLLFLGKPLESEAHRPGTHAGHTHLHHHRLAADLQFRLADIALRKKQRLAEFQQADAQAPARDIAHGKHAVALVENKLHFFFG